MNFKTTTHAIDQSGSILLRLHMECYGYVLFHWLQVILVTGISFGASLNERFGLPVIENLGGIPPGEW